MAFDPKQCRVLLVGKLMARLEPFLKSKGYLRVEAEESGQKAVSLLGSASYHLVLLELNLRDIELRDFFLEARGRQEDASFILLAPPTEAEMVVSALVLGADAYVALPPEESELFHVLERHGAAAVQRKSENPDAQPGVSEKVTALEEELATARAQLQDLEEQNALFEAEVARVNKLLEEAKRKASARPAAEALAPGHTAIATKKLEELESKATFAEFLESENDEIRRERDALLERLKELGLEDDAVVSDFDEPTGAILLDDDALAKGLPNAAPAPVAPSGDLADSDEGDEGDGDELLILDDGDDDGGDDGGDDGDDDAGGDDDDIDELSEEFDLAALEAMMAKSAPPRPATASAPTPAVAAPAPPVIVPPAPTPKPLPPPTADTDESGEGDFDDFEDVNTDALLRLAADVSGEGPTPDELEELLAAIDED